MLTHERETWQLQRNTIVKLLTTYLLYPKYSYRTIGDDVGCNKRTVQRYVRKWENNEDITQLEPCDIVELKRL